jgi:DNA-binding response OmpR family regulator
VKLLIAEDEYTTRLTVQVILEQWGYRVDSVEDGTAAWEILQRADGPQIAILDWEMPGIDGVELCHMVKTLERDTPVYVILLTGRDAQNDIIKGFDAGADDYITKPFDENELRARVRVAKRLVSIQEELAISNNELRTVLDHVEMLQTTLPVCNSCLRVQNYDESWLNLQEYVQEKDDPRFHFTICPHCQGKGEG